MRFQSQINSLIIGAGNGAHVMVSLIGSNPKVHTSLCTRIPEELKKINDSMNNYPFGIKTTNLDGSPPLLGKLVKTSTNLSEVASKADVIIMCLPAQFQEKYLEELYPCVKKGAIIGAFPGSSCFSIIAKKYLKEKFDEITLFAGNTLPWACRIKDFAKEVDLLGVKENMQVGTVPKSKNEEVCRMLQFLLGKQRKKNGLLEGSYPIFSQASLMSMTLMNMNGLVHPSILCGNTRFLKKGEELKDDNYFYYQGVDKFTEELLNEIWIDLFQIKNFIQKNFPNQNLSDIVYLHEFMKATYPHTIKDKSSVSSSFRTNEPYQGLKYPLIKTKNGGYVPDSNHRYFQEDIPTGMVPIKSIAELLEIKTPAIDKVIYWCQEYMDKQYIVDGKLIGRDVKDTRAVSVYGINSIQQFIDCFN